ncbi:PREDICTED: uncharacterized protein LOC109220469 isoform X2 [Nicotiana attenuata]|uniref:uncharacterized protein LOC109220469 isoform X2 n=1 Tax=Nicotiana attenuata TaxID=49451 RepID=UPI00090598A7|nr:PREDICTED: uncharacterized protein LOC109220469 isoform X2 [Nicotiana attenuata]
METAKMCRGLVMLSVMVAVAVLCSHRLAMAEEVAEQFDSELAQRGRWDASCRKFVPCVQNPSSSCITECCDSFNFWAPLPQKCSCWRTARNTNREALYALQNYCGFQPPTLCPHLQLQEVAETREAIDSKSSSNQQAATCCAKDKEKIKSCMFNTASIDQCCPTFKIMLGRNCDCYNYAKNLDNQALITLESYCDVTDPCNKAQVM